MYILTRNNNLSGELPESLRALTAVFQVAFDGNGCSQRHPNWPSGWMITTGQVALGRRVPHHQRGHG